MPVPDERSPLQGAEGRLRSIAGFALISLLALLGGAGALASLPTPTAGDAPMAIVFPFWMTRNEALARSFASGARVLRSGRLASIVVVAPEARLPILPVGAWFSLKLAGLAGCLDGGTAGEAAR